MRIEAGATFTFGMTSATFIMCLRSDSVVFVGADPGDENDALSRARNGPAMRVLHVISTLGHGGAEHQLRLLVRRLPYECEVVTLSRPGAVATALRAQGTTVHELRTSGD